MSTSAIILMVSVQATVIAITGYLYWKVMHIDKNEDKKGNKSGKE